MNNSSEPKCYGCKHLDEVCEPHPFCDEAHFTPFCDALPDLPTIPDVNKAPSWCPLRSPAAKALEGK